MKKLSLLLLTISLTLLSACSKFIGTYYDVYVVGANDFYYTVRVENKDHLVYKKNTQRVSSHDAPYVEGYGYISNLLKLYSEDKNNKLFFYVEDL